MQQMLAEKGYRNVEKARRAGIVIINTCAFIHDARQESIEAIKSFINTKSAGQKIIIAGCLSQRYQEKIFTDLPGVDAVIGTRDLYDLGRILERLEETGHARQLSSDFINIPKLVNPGEFHNTLIQGASSYLKIADGCHRNCAFCANPNNKEPWAAEKTAKASVTRFTYKAKGSKKSTLLPRMLPRLG